MICNLQKYAKSSWFPVYFLFKCHIMMQDIFFLSKLKTSFPPNKIYYRLWILWNCFRHVKGFFGIEGEKGASMRTRPYSCSWINYWFGLLLLLNYYVFVLMKISSWEVWKNTRKMAILVFLDLESELCLPCFATRWVRSKNPIVSWIKIEKTFFFNVFPLFLTGIRLHLESDYTQFVILFWKVYSLSNRSAAAPMGMRSRAIARVMVPSKVKICIFRYRKILVYTWIIKKQNLIIISIKINFVL